MKLTEAQIAHVKWLENEHGQITPDGVVADAKKKDSPLHDLFDWNKDNAANAWWVECAREIIRTVKYVHTVHNSTVRVPMYVRDPDADGQGYRSVMSLKRDGPSARQALIAELTRAAGCIERARGVALALNLSDEIESMIDQMFGLRARLEAEVSVEHAHAS